MKISNAVAVSLFALLCAIATQQLGAGWFASALAFITILLLAAVIFLIGCLPRWPR